MATVTDDFDRAELGTDWTVRVGSPWIEEEAFAGAASASANVAAWTAEEFYADQEVAATVTSPTIGKQDGGSPTIVVRCSASGRAAFLAFTADLEGGLSIWQRTGGDTDLTLATGDLGRPLAWGDVMKLSVTSAAITAYVNDEEVLTATTASVFAGQPGLGVYSISGAPTVRLDDFTATELLPEPEPEPEATVEVDFEIADRAVCVLSMADEASATFVASGSASVTGVVERQVTQDFTAITEVVEEFTAWRS